MLFTAKVLTFNVLCSIVLCSQSYKNGSKFNFVEDTNSANRRKRDILDYYDDNTIPHAQIHHIQKYFPVVGTRSGPIEGYMLTIPKGRKIFAFEGIPYAESTKGYRRFRVPRKNCP